MTGALTAYLEDALARCDRPVESSTGIRVEARRLLADAQAIAGELSAISPGEPVLAGLSNEPADLATLLGIWRAGGVAVPVAATAGGAAVDALQRLTLARLRVDGGRVTQVGAHPPPARELLQGAAFVIFTSGSTGAPKGVVIGHGRMAAKLGVLERLLGIGPHDTVVVPLRLTFIFGLWASLLALRVGARLVLVPRFTADSMATTLGEGATVLAAVPTMLRGLLAERVTAPALRLILTGGESLGAALAAQLASALPGTGVFDLYGLTETGSCDFCLPPADHAAAAGCIGRPTEGVSFRILRENGSSAGPGERGELCIATPFGMLGYLDDSRLTFDSFADGHFRTGDLAQVRPDGRVEIVGRIKDIISRGGNKIAPAEIDALLASHPDVAAALCAGVPDSRLGEALHAAVVLRPGATLSPQALRQWLAGRIERYKVPDAIHVCDALPVGATGKMRRAGVAEIARARGDQSPGTR
jgi:acyl-CoA synthetase (AMP-forming)/AMP-acid ligase II